MNCHPDRSEPGNPGERSGGTCCALDQHPTRPEARLFIGSAAEGSAVLKPASESNENAASSRPGGPTAKRQPSPEPGFPATQRWTRPRVCQSHQVPQEIPEGLGIDPEDDPSAGGAALNLHLSLTHSRASRRCRRQLRPRFVLWRPTACIAGADEPTWRSGESAARPVQDPSMRRERFRLRQRSCF
jgi:hypothetical protein